VKAIFFGFPLEAFNSLSRDHEVEEKLKEIEQDMFLSTPSLGITDEI